ncbi:MAG: hypothetical protein QOK43_939 [Acidimicrobiaceae bacterium]|nr:hypothetical protein [Acidimicrobiaceae bacterium]
MTTTDTDRRPEPASPRPSGKARQKSRQSLPVRQRRNVLKVHKWLSLVIGVWIAIQALTGSILVFQDQINAWSRPELFHHTGGDVGPRRAAQVAQARVPQGKLGAVQLPAMQSGVYVGVVNLPTPVPIPFGGPQRLVYVNPGTGRVNGVRNPNAGFTHWVSRVHEDLLQDEVFGLRGKSIVGWFGIISFVIVLAGIYIWYWPKAKRWANLLKPRRGRTAQARQANWHRSVALFCTPFLLVIFATGVNIEFPEAARTTWYRITPGKDLGPRNPFVPPKSTPQPGVKPLTMDQAVVRARAVTHGRVQSISPAFGPTGAFSVRVTKGWDPAVGPRGRGGNVTVYIDQYSGQPVARINPSKFPVAGQAYEYWAFPLHIGSTGGQGTRVLWLLVGFGLMGLAFTGGMVVLLRRRNRTSRRAMLAEAMPGMPQAVVDQTDEQAELVTVAAGSSVVKEGEPAEFFYVITAGEFDVVAGEPATRLNSLSVGHTFGEIGLLSTGVRTASVVARTDGEVLAVSVEDLNRIVEHAVAEGLDLHQAGARFAQEKIGAGGPGL